MTDFRERILNKLNEQDASNAKQMKAKIAEFISKNPTPSDPQIHSFAQENGINEHRFEEIIYSMIGDFWGFGKAKDFNGNYDPKELKMGINVEMEHTRCPLMAERIAKDHLAEIPDYYTRLAKMEKEAGVEH